MPPLTRLYINNEPYLHAEGDDHFIAEHDRSKVLSTEEVGDTDRYHVASLEIFDIDGKLYYHDERLKEFRLVGRPYTSLTYKTLDLLKSKGKAKLRIVPPHELARRLSELRQTPSLKSRPKKKMRM